jgi:hypothetical protein
LKLGISTKIEDTDQRWGIKKYKGKNCVCKEIGEKIKSGDEKCTEEKIVYKILFLLKLFVKVIPSFLFHIS